MQNLPTAEVYEKEFRYMPWGKLTQEVQEIVISRVPQDGAVLDLLCGTGYLLGEIQKVRSDIKFAGVDLEADYICYARDRHPQIAFEMADVLMWEKEGVEYDAVLCTAGVHHLPYDRQGEFIRRVGRLVKENGFAIIADPYIDDYGDESERKIAAAKLGYEYLAATIRNGASDDVIEATATLILNDVMGVEYKTSLKKIEPYFHQTFSHVDRHKTWPDADTEYGDYYFILEK